MKAFLITPFSAERAGHESPDDFAAVQNAIAEAAGRAGVELVHPARMHRPGAIVEQVESALVDADVVLAVITGQNPNVFYEIGRARRPAILVCRSSEDVPFDVRHLRYWTYGGAGEIDTLADRLETAIRASLAEPGDGNAERARRQSPPHVLRKELTAAFVGPTERGEDSALVTSFDEYRAAFGAPLDSTVSFLAPAVRGFFDNGGKLALVARVVSPAARPALFQTRFANGSTLAIWARSAGDWGNRIELQLRAGTRTGVRLTIACHPGPGGGEAEREDFDNSSLAGSGPNPLLERVNTGSRLVHVRSDAFALPPDLHAWLTGGADGPHPQAADYKATGLSVATGASDVDLICVPDHVHPTLSTDEQHALTDAIVETCDRTADRFALLATPGNEHDPERLKPTHDTEAAATYYPWLRTPSSEGFIPPIGHVAGALARSDRTTGVHAAPIGLWLEGTGPEGLEVEATPEARDTLTRLGVNALAIDAISKRPILVTAWNLAVDENRRYLNVTRLRQFLQRSIQAGLGWVTFESQSDALWTRIADEVSRFLRQLWESGVLYGDKCEEAFYVRCDRTTMTQDDIDNGRVILLYGGAMSGPPVSFACLLTLRTRPAAAAS